MNGLCAALMLLVYFCLAQSDVQTLPTSSLFFFQLYIPKYISLGKDLPDQYGQFTIFNYPTIPQSENPKITSSTLATVIDNNNNTTTKPPNTNQTQKGLTPATVISKQNSSVKSRNRTTFYKIFKMISLPMQKIIEIPKINSVLRNVGTCIVNGVMDILTFYLPSPLIPLIASTAGMMIPFEPIITLRRKMPVTSYRRAFNTAVNGFLNTFNRFKINNDEEDPYITSSFNRRFLAEDSKEKNKL